MRIVIAHSRGLPMLVLAFVIQFATQASAQFDLFHWTFSPAGLSAGQSVSATVMFINSGGINPFGNLVAYQTRAPVDAHVTVKAILFPEDGVCDAGFAVLLHNLDTTPLQACHTTVSLSFDVMAGDSFGFGVQTTNPGFPPNTHWTEFTFVPVTPLPPWTDLGGGVKGTLGLPVLTGQGFPIAGMPQKIVLEHGKYFALATLALGFSAWQLPFKGGVLVPAPDILIPAIPLDVNGDTTLLLDWPAGVPSGFTFYMQMWIKDDAAVQGYAASNGLSATSA
jgi:hypothetical protein